MSYQIRGEQTFPLKGQMTSYMGFAGLARSHNMPRWK